MTDHENVEVVRRQYAAFEAGDVDALIGLFSPDIVHHVPGSAAVSGDHRGPEAVLAMYGKLVEMSEGSISVVLEDLLSDGGHRVIAVHRATAERHGQNVTTREALMFTIVDGKVVEVQDFFTDIAAMSRFWS